MPEVPAWRAKGDWFDVCRCNVPCPCSWAEPPDDDYCEGVLVWHIREGRYGDVELDGLNVVGLGTFKGNVWADRQAFGHARVSTVGFSFLPGPTFA
jgi:hypothetical protein